MTNMGIFQSILLTLLPCVHSFRLSKTHDLEIILFYLFGGVICCTLGPFVPSALLYGKLSTMQSLLCRLITLLAIKANNSTHPITGCRDLIYISWNWISHFRGKHLKWYNCIGSIFHNKHSLIELIYRKTMGA